MHVHRAASAGVRYLKKTRAIFFFFWPSNIGAVGGSVVLGIQIRVPPSALVYVYFVWSCGFCDRLSFLGDEWFIMFVMNHLFCFAAPSDALA